MNILAFLTDIYETLHIKIFTEYCWNYPSDIISTHFVAHAHAVLKTVHTLFLEGYLMNLSLKTFQQLLLSFGSVEIYAYGQSGVRFISFQINLGFNLSVHKF